MGILCFSPRGYGSDTQTSLLGNSRIVITTSRCNHVRLWMFLLANVLMGFGIKYYNGRAVKLNELSGLFLNAGWTEVFYRKRQEIPGFLVADSIRYKSETIKLSTWKSQHGKNKYLRDQSKKQASLLSRDWW